MYSQWQRQGNHLRFYMEAAILDYKVGLLIIPCNLFDPRTKKVILSELKTIINQNHQICTTRNSKGVFKCL